MGGKASLLYKRVEWTIFLISADESLKTRENGIEINSGYLHDQNWEFSRITLKMSITHIFKNLNKLVWLISSQFSSVAQSCPTLCDPRECCMPGFPVHHQLLELAQTHVHPVRDAIQPSHPLSSPSPPTFNLYQHQGLFKWVSSSHQVTEYWSFSFSISSSDEYSGLISFRIDWLDLLLSKGLSRVFSNI